ncbi:MAG: response regulator [Chloroflexi bacterium]|nr:response regulator [Chloroflexota bacterium]
MDERTGQKRVLIVDDDERIVRFLGLKLKIAGYDVITAANGDEGLRLTESASPDIMVLDLIMPIIDGFEVLRRLHCVSNLPVIVLTARADACEEALHLGASDFIAKPFNPDELVKRIKAILGQTT